MNGKTIRLWRALALTAAFWFPAQGAAATGKQWQSHVAVAESERQGCNVAKKIDACTRMLAAFEKALTATDADEAAREEIIKPLLYTYRVAAVFQRTKGDALSAMALLETAAKRIAQHYDNGIHWHILFENAGVLEESLETLRILGQYKNIEVRLNNVRGAQDALYSEFEKLPCSKNQEMAMIYIATQSMRFEEYLAYHFRGIFRKDGQPDSLSVLSSHAFERMTKWNNRHSQIGDATSADVCKSGTAPKEPPTDNRGW